MKNKPYIYFIFLLGMMLPVWGGNQSNKKLPSSQKTNKESKNTSTKKKDKEEKHAKESSSSQKKRKKIAKIVAYPLALLGAAAGAIYSTILYHYVPKEYERRKLKHLLRDSKPLRNNFLLHLGPDKKPQSAHGSAITGIISMGNFLVTTGRDGVAFWRDKDNNFRYKKPDLPPTNKSTKVKSLGTIKLPNQEKDMPYFFTAFGKGLPSAWQLKEHPYIKDIPHNDNPDSLRKVPFVACSPIRNHVVTGDKKGNIKIWEATESNGQLNLNYINRIAQKQKPLLPPTSFLGYLKTKGPLTSMSFAPNGFLIASNKEKVFIFEWNEDKRTYVEKRKFRLSGPKAITSFAISPNGKYLALGCQQGYLQLHELSERETSDIRSYFYHGQESDITSMLYIDDQLIIAGREDGIVTFFYIGKELKEKMGWVFVIKRILWHIEHPSAVTSLHYQSDKKVLWIGGKKGQLNYVKVDIPYMVEQFHQVTNKEEIAVKKE